MPCLRAWERELYTAHRLTHCRECLRILPRYLVKDGVCHYCLNIPVDEERVRTERQKAIEIGRKLKS
ncbi:hypothetical protein PSR1_00800 [Anaeromyxobacter sp. PSR-1]|nr:hypothetical protein PSR1_00800 [Anaeromyxobacter sp. PSR-1]